MFTLKETHSENKIKKKHKQIICSSKIHYSYIERKAFSKMLCTNKTEMLLFYGVISFNFNQYNNIGWKING